MQSYGVEMTDDEITGFLAGAGYGTLAFGGEDGGYAIPMSFGYNDSEDCCVFQFAFGTHSRKRAYIRAGKTVTLTADEWDDIDHWQSVVVRGTLQRIEDKEAPAAAEVFADQAKIASLDVFQQPLEELDLEWYELQIEEKQGRRAEALT